MPALHPEMEYHHYSKPTFSTMVYRVCPATEIVSGGEVLNTSRYRDLYISEVQQLIIPSHVYRHTVKGYLQMKVFY